ncbi:MAG: transcriptional regulator [Methanobacteriota archaeon]
MKTCVKCEMCQAEISGEKCVFATYKKVIDGKEHYFCCENHAKEFERKMKRKKG